MPVFRKEGTSILYIHVPKTGGSSVESAFRQSGYRVDYLDGKVGNGTLNHLRRSTPQHMHAEVLQALFRLEHFDVIFMIVRNPVQRFQSEYLWRTRNRRADLSPEAVEAWGLRTFDRCRKNPCVYDNHIRPQVDFSVDGASVWQFESGIQTILTELDTAHNLNLAGEVPRQKSATDTVGRTSADVEVSDDLATAIFGFYAEDFTTFGYSTDIP